jgi:hypothetical protein
LQHVPPHLTIRVAMTTTTAMAAAAAAAGRN